MNKEREFLETMISRKKIRDVAAKNTCDYFKFFSKNHIVWIKKLTERYKEYCEYPIFPASILPSYYTERRDKEVAAFAAFLISDNESFERIADIKEAITEKPWEWFTERGFVRLSLGAVQNKRTGGIENWKISTLFDKLHKEWSSHSDSDTLFNCIVDISKAHRCSYFDAILWLLEGFNMRNVEYKVRLLLLILGRSDGFSINLWRIAKQDIKCPVTGEIKEFMKLWIPNYTKIGTTTEAFDRAVDLFGFENAGDFFYSFLAWKRMCEKDPAGCARYAETYQRWYFDGYTTKPFFWRRVQPDINLI